MKKLYQLQKYSYWLFLTLRRVLDILTNLGRLEPWTAVMRLKCHFSCNSSLFLPVLQEFRTSFHPYSRVWGTLQDLEKVWQTVPLLESFWISRLAGWCLAISARVGEEKAPCLMTLCFLLFKPFLGIFKQKSIERKIVVEKTTCCIK